MKSPDILNVLSQLLLLLLLHLPAGAQSSDGLLDLNGGNLRENANGALGVLGLSIVPNETASAISIDASGGDTTFLAGQFGGAFTVSDEFPLYMEGFLGIARYDPTFVFSNGERTAIIPAKWTSISGTVGAGWDFALTDELALRPIVNFSLGHIESDVSLIGRVVESEIGEELEFLEDGRLSAYGYGGSFMFDWEHYRPDYEIDVELRYTHIRLESFANSSAAVRGGADAITLGLWSRLRVPTGLKAFGRPLRGVAEFAVASFIGDQSEALDSPYLVQVGGGIEFDFAKVSWLPVSRTRLLGRFVFGNDLTGFTTGISISL